MNFRFQSSKSILIKGKWGREIEREKYEKEGKVNSGKKTCIKRTNFQFLVFHISLSLNFEREQGPIIQPYWDFPTPHPHESIISLDKQQNIDVDTLELLTT